MLDHLKKALVDKLEGQRDQEPHYTIQWLDTKKIEVIPQSDINISPSQQLAIDVTDTFTVNGIRRRGTVLAIGTKTNCEIIRDKHTLHESREHVEKSPADHKSSTVDSVLLMRILGKVINNPKSDENHDGEDIHDTQCASCGVKPIRHVDRYRCLECPSPPGYDLCGHCFEKRLVTGRHQLGHAMGHFILPNELLGVHFNDINNEVTLNGLKQLDTFRSERHEGIKCDGVCHQQNIIGLRFKCDICSNYDLCEPCAIKNRVTTKTHTRDHPLILTSSKNIPKIDPHDIEMGQDIGRGGFGKVCEAIWRPKNRRVACKIIDISKKSLEADRLKQSFFREIAAYRELSGPYIIRIYGYASRELSNHIIGPKTQLMIIMELMGKGSLQNVLDNEPNKLSLRRKLSMSRQIASGMRRIHQHGMIHRDIRPDNILVNNKYNAKIGDMGIARVLDPKGQQTAIGCLEFMPPEFFQNSSDHYVNCNEKLDIYTYGLTLNQLFTGKIHKFHLSAHGPNITLTKQSPVFYEEIILKCLDNDTKRRPTANEIEKTLLLYEQTFAETLNNDDYVKLNTREKDRIFLEFYDKNKSRIQHFIEEQASQEIKHEPSFGASDKQNQFPSTNISYEQKDDDRCRIN